MNNQRFHDLAIKIIARQGNEADRAELDSLMAEHPELKAEFERLRGDVRVAKELLPVADATQASAGEFPAYARERLQTKVRQTLGSQKTSQHETLKNSARLWRWWVGLATATAVIVILLVPVLIRPTEPIVQLAILDVAGDTRGQESKEAVVLRQTWSSATVNSFSTPDELGLWEKDWPTDGKRAIAKVVLDRTTGEVRVWIRSQGRLAEKTFPLAQDAAKTLKEAKTFVEEQFKR